MKPLSLAALVLTSIVGFHPGADAARCEKNVTHDIRQCYTINDVYDVGDVQGLCKGLIDNSRRFPPCLHHESVCYPVGQLEFEWVPCVNKGCSKEMIEAIWWEATRNKYGDITCPDGWDGWNGDDEETIVMYEPTPTTTSTTAQHTSTAS